MSTEQPYTFAEAADRLNASKVAQAQNENSTREASTALAEKERVYRMALATRIVELHAEGVAWTVAQDVARGEPRVAQLRMERDIAAGVREAFEQAGWRYAADRRAILALVEWSAKRDLAEGYEPQTGTGHTFGARRAA